jgi:hypothetical protein
MVLMLELGYAYLVYSDSEVSLEIKGNYPSKPSQHLSEGWNMVCYLGSTGAVEDALATISQQLQAVKNTEVFYLHGNNNINSLTELNNQEAYFIKLNAPATIQYLQSR